MNPLVSLAWLAERLHDSGVTVLDATLPPVGVTPKVDTRARYLARHIPGAVFFDIDRISDHNTSLPHMLPSEEEFARAMGALGVGDRSTLVVYEQEGVYSAPRARWMLGVMGARDRRLLDGDLRAWVKAGLPVESGEVVRPAAHFAANLDRRAVADFDTIQRTIAEGGQILDARSSGRFSGRAAEPRPGLKSGHMPRALNLPFTEAAEGGRMKSPEALRTILHAKGINLDLPVTTTCGSGVTAAVLALGLELAGAKSIHLYDGSWSEYAGRPEAVIVNEAPKTASS